MKRATHLPAEHAIPTRYSLLSRLQDRSDQQSWKDFFDTYWRLIYSLAVRSGLSETEAQEVVQETVITVARDIHKFKRDRSLGTFKGWLRNIIRWRIADQFRKRSPTSPQTETGSPMDDSMPDLNEIPDTSLKSMESHWEEEWRANLFDAALDRVKRKIREEHYQIFDCYVIKGWPVAEVARATRVNAARVYLVKHRVSSMIRKELQALEKELF